MMRIIERGAIKRPSWQGQFRCPACRTLYEVSSADSEVICFDDRYARPRSVTAVCEVCGQIRQLAASWPEVVVIEQGGTLVSDTHGNTYTVRDGGE